MEKYFVYSMKLKTTEKNPQHGLLNEAYSHTWVRAESQKVAREMVFEYYLSAHWLIAEIEHEKEGDLSLHPWNHRASQPDSDLPLGLYKSWIDLKRHGIGGEIFASPARE